MQKKYKILLASETYSPNINGAAIFVERLAKMLSASGHKVLVVAPSSTYNDKVQEETHNLTVHRIKSIPLKPIHPYFRATWKGGLTKKIRKIIEDFAPDIIHIHNHFLLGRTCLKIARQMDIPIMGTNHFMPDNLMEYFPKILEKPVSTYMWKDFIKVYNKLDYVTAPTKVALSMIKDLGLKTPSKVISNGIDLSDFKKIKVSDSIYKKFHLKKKLPVFLFVGRLERDKNVDLILKAMALNKGKLRSQTVIVGEGRDEDSFKKLSKKLRLDGSVVFTGRVSDSDLKQLYALSDVYLGSGSAELQGLSVMEAMANGLPVLAANAVALPELVEDGVNGYLFELDEADLAKKMLKILKDPEKLISMSRKSLSLIQKHSKENTVKSFVDIYTRLIF